MKKTIFVQREEDDYLTRIKPEKTKRIYSAVLEEAWKKDESLNEYEINILEVLRNELELTKREHYLLESRIGRFPKKDNKLHTNHEIGRSLINLQARGLILRYREEKTYYIITKDISRIFRYE